MQVQFHLCFLMSFSPLSLFVHFSHTLHCSDLILHTKHTVLTNEMILTNLHSNLQVQYDLVQSWYSYL